MKKWVILTAAVLVLGVVLSVVWQSMYSRGQENYNSTANLNAHYISGIFKEYFAGSDEAVSGVFTGELSDSDPLAESFPEDMKRQGYYYVLVENSEVVQCYWERGNSFSGRADELTEAIKKGKPPSYIATKGDPIGGYPEPVDECRTWYQWLGDEWRYIAYDYIPLLAACGYVLVLGLWGAVKKVKRGQGS